MSYDEYIGQYVEVRLPLPKLFGFLEWNVDSKVNLFLSNSIMQTIHFILSDILSTTSLCSLPKTKAIWLNSEIVLLECLGKTKFYLFCLYYNEIHYIQNQWWYRMKNSCQLQFSEITWYVVGTHWSRKMSIIVVMVFFKLASDHGKISIHRRAFHVEIFSTGRTLGV